MMTHCKKLLKMQRGVLSLFLVSGFTYQAAAADKPNIVVVYADDAGYADFGFQPNVHKDMKKLTPHIDGIARDGVRFAQAYMTCSTCSPSRAGIMTGRYQQRFGHDLNIAPGTNYGLPRSETFGAKRLQTLGYKTGLIGKWHLGSLQPFRPTNRGFDWFYGLLNGSRPYYVGKKVGAGRAIREAGGKIVQKGESNYVTDLFGDAACQFIAKHKEEPFFLFVSFTAPHGPYEPRKSDADRVKHIKADSRGYAGLIVALDDNVGKILAALKQAGIDDKTLVVFTNDNGGIQTRAASNAPLRGGKGTWWEGGFRVPMAMRWPGKIKPGTVVGEPVISLDLVPTFLSITGGKIDPDWKLDGMNLLPRLTGQQDRLPARTLYWRRWNNHAPVIVVRENNWRLVFGRDAGTQPPELFDLDKDIGETKNLAAAHPKIVAALTAKGLAWQKDFPGPLWRGGRPASAKVKEDEAE